MATVPLNGVVTTVFVCVTVYLCPLPEDVVQVVFNPAHVAVGARGILDENVDGAQVAANRFARHSGGARDARGAVVGHGRRDDRVARRGGVERRGRIDADAQVADAAPNVGVVEQMISGPVPTRGMLAGHDAVGLNSVVSSTVQVVLTWSPSYVGGPTVQGAEGTAPWLLAAIGKVQSVVIRVPPSSAGLQVGTATGAG